MKTKMSSSQIWDTNIFLIKYLFLITELNYNRDNANDVANTKFKKLSLIDKINITRKIKEYLNK
jgi:hypothetical protein